MQRQYLICITNYIKSFIYSHSIKNLSRLYIRLQIIVLYVLGNSESDCSTRSRFVYMKNTTISPYWPTVLVDLIRLI